MKKFFYILVSFFIFFSVLSISANEKNPQQGKVVSSSPLHKLPQYKSPIITELASDKAIHIFQRKRAWYQINTDDDITGWIKMLNVRFTGVLKREGELGVKDMFDSVITRQTKPTTSTGIRGFDEADLQKAKANLQQLAILNSYQISPIKAQQFARQGKLKPHGSISTELSDFTEISDK